MIYGYTRVSTKGQLDGNSIEEQIFGIKLETFLLLDGPIDAHYGNL